MDQQAGCSISLVKPFHCIANDISADAEPFRNIVRLLARLLQIDNLVEYYFSCYEEVECAGMA